MATLFSKKRRVDGSRIFSEYFGNLWWHDQYPVGKSSQTTPVLFAAGDGGQFIFVLPEHNLLAIFTGENYASPRSALPIQLVKKYVLPSLE